VPSSHPHTTHTRPLAIHTPRTQDPAWDRAHNRRPKGWRDLCESALTQRPAWCTPFCREHGTEDWHLHQEKKVTEISARPLNLTRPTDITPYTYRCTHLVRMWCTDYALQSSVAGRAASRAQHVISGPGPGNVHIPLPLQFLLRVSILSAWTLKVPARSALSCAYPLTFIMTVVSALGAVGAVIIGQLG
jgi:hypothetical protein